MSSIISIQNVSFSYEEAEDSAVKGVSLEVEKGEFLAILGRNGSGKSTLAKLLNALILPTDGAISVDGISPTDEDSRYEIRTRCGMVFQNPDNQIVSTIVEEDCAFGLENMGVAPQEIRRRVDEALARVGMAEYALSSPHMLSGGQKQRVAIAGVVAMRPKIIVFDESTAMLDPVGRREVLTTVHKLNRERGITVVLITHHMNEAMEADRAIVMNRGQVAMDGTPRAVFARVEELRALGLAAPDTVELLYELRSRGIDIPLDAMTVEDCADAICHAFSGEK